MQQDIASIKQKLLQVPDPQKNRKKFLYKLFALLEENNYPSIITWSDDGQKIVLKDHNLLAEKILPQLFTHGNYSSFIRQLSFYRFKKVSEQFTDIRVYQHPFFLKGHMELLSKIERVNCVKDSGKEKPKEVQPEESVSTEKLEHERTEYIARQKILVNQLRFAQDTIQRLRSQNYMLHNHLAQKLNTTKQARETFSYLQNRFCGNENSSMNPPNMAASHPLTSQSQAPNREIINQDFQNTTYGSQNQTYFSASTPSNYSDAFQQDYSSFHSRPENIDNVYGSQNQGTYNQNNFDFNVFEPKELPVPQYEPVFENEHEIYHPEPNASNDWQLDSYFQALDSSYPLNNEDL